MKRHKKKWREVTNRWFFLSFIICITESYLIAFSPSVFANVDCTLPQNAGSCAVFPQPPATPPPSSATTDGGSSAGGSSGGTTAESPPVADGNRGVANQGTPSTPTANPGGGGIRSRFKKFVFGDSAAVRAYSQGLQSEFQGKRQKCEAEKTTPQTLPCPGPNLQLLCNSPVQQLTQVCGKNIPVDKFEKLQGAQQEMANLAQSLAGKLGVDSQSILSDIQNQADVNCGKAWQLAKVTCQFPVQALGGKVTKALSTIGKVAITGQAVAGLAGKSLNDLCKALTTLSGAGVTISMLARAKCAFAMKRCKRFCDMEKYSQPGYCNKLKVNANNNCVSGHNTDILPCRTATPPPTVTYRSCVPARDNLKKYKCHVQHINEMKQGCSFLKNNTMGMMKDILQLIATVKSAKMCLDKTGGDMSALSPEACREMGGTPYTDETTGEERCRFREPSPGEGVCPPYGVPVSCNQTCEDGSVPAGCPTGVCESGEIVSCTNTCPNGSVPTGCDNICPDPALTYPNCDCNCPSGQSCNSNRQCVVARSSCTSATDCDEGQVCNNGTCVSNPDRGGQSCTESNDCGPDKICQNGRCFCDCQGSPISCSEQCGGRCLEDSVSCSCQGNGECTPPQQCVPSANGNVCSDDDGMGVCPDGSRISCAEVCSDGSQPANCRSCNGDSDCEEGQICNKGICVEDDPILEVDGAGGGGAPDDELEDPLAITNDGMGGGDGNSSDGSNNTGKLPSASSGKQTGLVARLGTLLGVGKGGGAGGFRSGRRSGSRRGNQQAKGGDKNSAAKGAGSGGGFGGYGAGGGGAGSSGSSGLNAAQKKKKGNKSSAFPSKLGNIGSVHQDIFKAVTARYKKVYNLK